MKKSILKLFYTSKLKDKKISKDTDEEEFKEILLFFYGFIMDKHRKKLKIPKSPDFVIKLIMNFFNL